MCSLPTSLTKNAGVLKNVLAVQLDWPWSKSALLTKWKRRFVAKLAVTP